MAGWRTRWGGGLSRGDGHRPWLWVLLGAPVALAGALLLVSSAGEWRDRAAYLRAPVCEGGRTGGCVVEASAVVERKWVRRRRLDRYEVRLWHYPGAPVRDDGRWTELPEPDAVWEHLTRERTVGVRIWDGHVARIDVAGRSAETEHSPVVDAVERPMWGVLLLPVGAFATGAGVVMGRRYGWARATGVPAFETRRGPLRLLVALMASAVVAMFVVTSFDVYSPRAFLTYPIVGLPVWLLLGRVRPRA